MTGEGSPGGPLEGTAGTRPDLSPQFGKTPVCSVCARDLVPAVPQARAAGGPAPTVSERLCALPEDAQALLLEVWEHVTGMTTAERETARLMLGFTCIQIAMQSTNPDQLASGHLIAATNDVVVHVDDPAKELNA